MWSVIVAEVLERVEQPIAKRRVEFFVADLAYGAHGGLELLQIVLAAVAVHQVGLEAGPGLRVERVVEVSRDQFDQLVAVHSVEAHEASSK